MSDRLVTIATFGSPVEGNLARNRLDAAGIKCLLLDEEIAGMAWHLTNAIGGVKLQVQEQDAEEAMAILAEGAESDQFPADQTEEAPAAPCEDPSPAELHEPHPDDAEPALSRREQNAERAYRAAVLGLLFLPLHLYVFWLLLKVYVSNERLEPVQRRHALVAAAINLPLMLVFCLLLNAILST